MERKLKAEITVEQGQTSIKCHKATFAKVLQRLAWLSAVLLVAWLFYDVPIHLPAPVPQTPPLAKPIAQQDDRDVEELRREIASLLALIEKESQASTEGRIGQLNGPASAGKIMALEQYTGVPLPRDFRCYLELHDGQASAQGGFIDYSKLLTVDEILSQSRELAQLGSNYYALPLNALGEWFHHDVLLFEEMDGAGYGVHVYTGEILRWDHDGGQLHVVAPSFRDMLFQLVAEMRANNGYRGGNLEKHIGAGNPLTMKRNESIK